MVLYKVCIYRANAQVTCHMIIMIFNWAYKTKITEKIMSIMVMCFIKTFRVRNLFKTFVIDCTDPISAVRSRWNVAYARTCLR